MATEEDQAYAVLAKRFGFSATYIKSVLERHFESPSDAGWEHMKQACQVEPKQDTPRTIPETLESVKDALYRIDKLRAEGHLPPLQRYVSINAVKKNKRGKYYVASEEELQAELAMQDQSSIDPDGNLVVNGQIVKYGWLQSFVKADG